MLQGHTSPNRLPILAGRCQKLFTHQGLILNFLKLCRNLRERLTSTFRSPCSDQEISYAFILKCRRKQIHPIRFTCARPKSEAEHATTTTMSNQGLITFLSYIVLKKFFQVFTQKYEKFDTFAFS